MFLVAGLAVAGLAGIAAAFYFSIRSGKGGRKRLRPGGAGRSGAGRTGADRGPSGRASRDYQGEDDTGPGPALDFGDPVLIGARRGSQAASADRRVAGTAGSRQLSDRFEPDESQATDPGLVSVNSSESGPGARLSDEAGDAVKSRRRMGFRKGTGVDEELWPVEAFGGVSDEQFWDDLAADKPLTTTARTAQQDSGPRKRPLGAPPAAGPRGAGSGTYPEPRTGPNPATERTTIQPAYAATPPAPSMTSQIPDPAQVPGAARHPAETQLVKTGASGSQPTNAAGKPSADRRPPNAASRPASVPSRPASPPSPPSRPASAPSWSARPPAQPAETRGRRRASSAEEDPLTSAAFALRPSGPVDGRSSLRASGSSVTQAMTPPHGESYGYGSRHSAPAGDNPRRPNSTPSHARPSAAGAGGQRTRPARHAYPQDGYQTGNGRGTGGYPSTGSYPTPGYPVSGYPVSGYPVNGYPGSGQRAPYDPREDYRRLTHSR